jgi:hypothetical protein
MKLLFPTLLCLLLFSCKQSDNMILPSNEKIEQNDLTESTAMRMELSSMGEMLDSLTATNHHSHQLHWDSLYHYHDSLFWHHHNLFHHDHYTHDDHHHTWTDYDPHVDHTHHFHHTYPGHEHDSLITDHSIHVHDNNDHHYEGHDWQDHHLLDSLHNIHNAHHP